MLLLFNAGVVRLESYRLFELIVAAAKKINNEELEAQEDIRFLFAGTCIKSCALALENKLVKISDC